MSGWAVHPDPYAPPVAMPPSQAQYGFAGVNVIVRPMQASDADFVGEMVIEAFREKMVHAVGESGIPRMVEANRKYYQMIGERYHRYLVAEVGGRPAGVCQMKMHGENYKEPDFDWGNYIGCCGSMRFCCLACCDETPGDRKCYVEVLGVGAGYRGKGIGKALLEQADREAINMGCNMIYLHVTTTNPAIRLYERQGYRNVGEKDGCCCLYCGFGVRYFYTMEKRL